MAQTENSTVLMVVRLGGLLVFVSALSVTLDLAVITVRLRMTASPRLILQKMVRMVICTASMVEILVGRLVHAPALTVTMATAAPVVRLQTCV
jgi:starvation-inducible outer membrane lipoprotein